MAASRSAIIATLVVAAAVLQPEAVQAILGANPNPKPTPQPPVPGVSSGQCVWDAGGSQGDLTLTVMQALDGVKAQIFDAMPMEGDAVSSLGDEAGVADKKEAVLAAARAAVAKLD